MDLSSVGLKGIFGSNISVMMLSNLSVNSSSMSEMSVMSSFPMDMVGSYPSSDVCWINSNAGLTGNDSGL